MRYIIADACDYGIPQHRTRTHIVAFKDKAACDGFKFPKTIPLSKRLREVIDFSIKAEAELYYQSGTVKYERLNRGIIDSN